MIVRYRLARTTHQGPASKNKQKKKKAKIQAKVFKVIVYASLPPSARKGSAMEQTGYCR